MSKVNLIPNWVRDTQDRRGRQKVWMIIVATVAAIAMVWVGLKYMVCLRAEREFRQASQGCIYLDNQLKLLAQTESRLDRLQGRLAIIKQLGYYHDPIEIMGFLTKHTPAQIYLREISVTRPKREQGESKLPVPIPAKATAPIPGMFQIKASPTPNNGASKTGKMQLLLRGNGPTHLVTAGYLTALYESPFFTHVDLIHATRTQLPDAGDAIEFEIVCTLDPIAASHSLTDLTNDNI